MSQHIMITCPVGNRPARTGFRAQPGSRLDALKAVRLHRCPVCGTEHVWSGREAYWVEYVREPSRWEGFRQFWRGHLPSKAATQRRGARH